MPFLFQRPHYSNNVLKNFYYKTFGFPHVGTRIRGRAVFRVFPNLQHLKILDIGCGSGVFSYELAKRGHHVVSLDSLAGITQHDVHHLKKIFKKGGYDFRFVRGTATKLPFLDSSFDAVVIADVIEHIIDEDTVMKEIHRVLKPDGFFIASTPLFGFHRGKFKGFFRFLHRYTFLKHLPLWDTVQLYPASHMKSEGHVREYTLEHWKKLCTKHGFVLEAHDYEYKLFGAFFVELYHTFTFVDHYGNYFFPFFYPFTLLDYFLPIKGTGIAVRAHRL